MIFIADIQAMNWKQLKPLKVYKSFINTYWINFKIVTDYRALKQTLKKELSAKLARWV